MTQEITLNHAVFGPNEVCADCPILEIDQQAANEGSELAADDYRRHSLESINCGGTEREQRAAGLVRKCPLFGFETSAT